MDNFEHTKRSITKAITHRIGSFVITFSVLFIMGMPIYENLLANLAMGLIKIVPYLLHERVWSFVPWGYKR